MFYLYITLFTFCILYIINLLLPFSKSLFDFFYIGNFDEILENSIYAETNEQIIDIVYGDRYDNEDMNIFSYSLGYAFTNILVAGIIIGFLSFFWPILLSSFIVFIIVKILRSKNV